MADASSTKRAGTIQWVDLTVADADTLREFYGEVAGWKVEPVDMGGYEDYSMLDANGTPAAGICHARGSNANLPAQWLIYITVPDLSASLENCTRRGGEIISGPTELGEHGAYAVIRDPAGAVAALVQPPRQT